MGKKACVLVLILGISLVLGISSSYANRPPIVEKVEQKSGIKWESYHLNPATGLISSLGRAYPGSATAGVSSTESSSSVLAAIAPGEGVAIEFLMLLKEELGIGDISEISVDDVITYHYTEPGYTDRDYSMLVRFHQVYYDIPVFETFGLVAMTKHAEFYRLKHIWYPDISAPTAPSLSAEDVKQVAADHYGEADIDFFEEPELCILAPDKLAWWVKMGEPVHRDALIDAVKGDVIRDWDNLVAQIPDGHCYVHGTVRGSTDGINASNEPLSDVEAKILDDDGLSSQTFWQGRTDSQGRYNETSPQYVSIWDGVSQVDKADLYCEAYLDDSRVVVRDGSTILHRIISARNPESSTFEPDNQQSYVRNIAFDNDIQMEGACAFREVRRGFDYSGKSNKVEVRVHDPDPLGQGPRTDGVKIYLLDNWSALPSDVTLHEFGHTVMYENYGGHWALGYTKGRPGECPNDCGNCDNHGGINNGCSADAIGEGWAHYFAVAVYNKLPTPDNPPDTSVDFPAAVGGQSGDLEGNNAVWGWSDAFGPLRNNYGNSNGRRSEAVVASILWDIHDGQNGADSDHLWLGDAAVSHIMMHQQPYTTKELYEDLYFEYPESRAQLWEIFHNHGISDADAPTSAPSNLSSSINAEIAYLSWDSVTDVNMAGLNQNIASGTMYVVQIDTSDTFPAPQEYEVASTMLYLPLQPSTTYHWRVEAQDYAGNSGPFSGSRSFTTGGNAIAKGLNWLRNHQNPDGSWGTQLGITELVTLAFFNYGVTEGDNIDTDGDGTPDIEEAMNYILSYVNVQGDGGIYGSYPNYETSIGILVLVAADQTNAPRKYTNQITDAKDFLLSIQNMATQTTALPNYTDQIAEAEDFLSNLQNDPKYTSQMAEARAFLSSIQNVSANGNISIANPFYGGWGYWSSPSPVWADLSNTQWSLMGLDAAYSYLGLAKPDPDTPGTWTAKALIYLERCQNHTTNDQPWAGTDGGFIYMPGLSQEAGGTTSAGSMTYAGIWSMLLTGLNVADARVQAALNWAGNNYSVTDNPPVGDWSLYYYYISMAKALAMAGQLQLNGHDWFEELSTELLNAQYPDGYWYNPNPRMEDQQPLATAYALLALETRTLPPAAELWMSIILASNADLHVYDLQGRHVGKNYTTGQIEMEIPGASFGIDPQGRQIINVNQLQASTYRIELVGTGDGDYSLTVEGYRDEKLVSSETFSQTIRQAETQTVDAVVGAMAGALTIYVEEPKQVPGGLVATPGDKVIDLTWSPVIDPELLGYKVYYGTASRSYGPPIDVGNITSYRLTGLTNDVTYYIAVTAYYTEGRESGYSIEVSAIPIILDIEILSVTFNVLDLTLIIEMDDEAEPDLTNFDLMGMEVSDSGNWDFQMSQERGLRIKETAPSKVLNIDMKRDWINASQLTRLAVEKFHPVDFLARLGAFRDAAGIKSLEVTGADDMRITFVANSFILGTLGDVSGNGEVTAFDGALMVKAAVHGLSALPITSTTSEIDERLGQNTNIAMSTADMNNDGRIDSSDALAALSKVAGRATMAPPDIASDTKRCRLSVNNYDNGKLDVSIDLEDVSGVYCVDIVMSYDPGTLTVAHVSKTSSISDWVFADAAESGKLRISMAGLSQPAANGSLVNVSIDAASADAIKELQIVEFKLNGGRCRVEVEKLPKAFALMPNYPNPFNPDTWIPYQLAQDVDVTIRIHDVAGHLVRTLSLGQKPAGFYTTKDRAAYWDGRNETGEQVASGVYFYTIQAGEFTATKKMVIAE